MAAWWAASADYAAGTGSGGLRNHATATTAASFRAGPARWVCQFAGFAGSLDILLCFQRYAPYPVVIITCVHYLGPPGPSTSQILGTFSRFSEDFLGRERDP